MPLPRRLGCVVRGRRCDRLTTQRSTDPTAAEEFRQDEHRCEHEEHHQPTAALDEPAQTARWSATATAAAASESTVQQVAQPAGETSGTATAPTAPILNAARTP